MSKYKNVPFIDGKKAGWRIVEENTKQIVGESIFEDHVFDTIKFLEKGCAFNGFTPHFFTIPTFNLDYKLTSKSR